MTRHVGHEPTYGISPYGAGVGYETDFASWRTLLRRIVGEAAEEQDETASAAPF